MQPPPDPLQWLAAGVPLTLLIDLATPVPPDSADILAAEPADTRWVPRAPHAA